jgi:Putative transposase/Transposase zinc-binding domain
MSRPTLEVADIFRAQADNFINKHDLGVQQLKVIRAIVRCRTAALGGHADVCPRCDEDPVISYNSCRNRHCNKCQAQARRRWVDARKLELLPTRYFHVVFTLPHELHTLILQNQAELYNLLFRTVAATLREIARNPKNLGAQIGFFGILHTWGQNLLFHPHIHCVIPGGGISPNKERWIHPKYPFLLPVKALAKVFRGKFVAGLRRAHHKERLTCAGSIHHLTKPKYFSVFLRTLFRQDWVVYAKPAFGGPEQVIRYLGRYTHRVAISNHRLISFDGGHVTFRWRDYAGGNKMRTMTVPADEFIRRFLLHVLPKGFVRIRHFGVMANYQRSESIALCRKLLEMTPLISTVPGCSAQLARSLESRPPNATWLCPRCHAPMMVIARLTAAQLFWMLSANAFVDSS